MSETPLIDDQNKKSEQLNDDNDFLKRAGKGALALGLAIGVGMGGAAATESWKASAAQTEADERAAAEKARTDALDQQLTSTYPVESVIGEITIPEGGTILGQAEGVLGDNLTSENYDVFMRSAGLQGTVQPGEKLAIVQTDLDTDASNGTNVFVVRPTQIHHGVATELPTPDTH